MFLSYAILLKIRKYVSHYDNFPLKQHLPPPLYRVVSTSFSLRL